jgi:peptide/nickel transport system permease protein
MPVEVTYTPTRRPEVERLVTRSVQALLNRVKDIPVVLAISVLIVAVIAAAFAPLVAPHDAYSQDLRRRLEMPSREHLLGTDELGRDVLSRLIWGSRVALQVGFIAVGLALAIGVPIGLLAGYTGGRLDAAMMRVMDGVLAFPPVLLALAIIAGLGPGIRNATIAIGVVFIPTFARLARSTTLVIRETEYVLAARALGATVARVLSRHILPNGMAPLIVQASLAMSVAVVTEASLAYLGLGSQPPDPSWGVMLRQSASYMSQNWFVTLPPGLAIFAVAVSLNVLGDHMRDMWDPRLRGRW